MLKIAICDDEIEELNRTENLVKKWAEANNSDAEIHCFNNGDDLLTVQHKINFDIVLLDIIMPLLNGLDTAKEIRTINNVTKIIFLTSSPEFALDSYQVKAYDYILKPAHYDKLGKALTQCTSAVSSEPKGIVLKTANGYQRIYFHNMEYIEAQNKKVVIHIKDGNPIEVTEPLHTFERQLTLEQGFFKCHRSYIVYIKNVDHFNTSQIFTAGGKSIPIARGSAKAFEEAYFSTMFDNQTRKE